MTNLPSKKKKALRVTLIVIGALLAVLLLLVGVYLYLYYRGAADLEAGADDMAAVPYRETVEKNGKKYVYNKNVVAIAMIGVDKERLGNTEADENPIGMADLTAVAVLDRSTGKMSFLNIPRDTICDVDVYNGESLVSTKKRQICTAFSYGDGKKTSCENVVLSLRRLLYGAPIAKFVCLDMDGIAPINDALGGVTLVSDVDIPFYGIRAGETVTLKGAAAQAYLRTRDHDDLAGSADRVSRQTQYFVALTSRMFETLKTDFGRLPGLYATGAAHTLTDITLENATYLGTLLVRNGVQSLNTRSLTGRFEAEAIENSEDVYARFLPDADALEQTVLDLFYTEVK